MPELPEVEVVRRGLADHVAGRTVAEVEIGHPRAVRRHQAGAADLSARLRGRVVGEPRRRGKYLWLPLDAAADGDEALVAHLGMSGQLLVASPQAPDGPHLRVRVRFRDGGDELRFVDQRTFGGLAVEPTDEQGVPASVRHIARDPFDPQFDDAGFVSALRRRRTETKRALLDQTLVSGVGNIYADEALWRARIHPRRPTGRLSAAEARRLLDAVRGVMAAALEQGGTTFDGLYLNVNGASGYFDRSLDAYGRAGLPCRRCGTAMVRERFTNRSSCFCPRCQPRPRVRRSGDSA